MGLVKQIAEMLCAVIIGSMAVSAQESLPLSALARVVPDQTGIADYGGALVLDLGLTQAVPYRVFTLDKPRRLVVDFREVDWAGFPGNDFLAHEKISAVRAGAYQAGWSRLVLAMGAPHRIDEAGMITDQTTGGARVRVVLTRTDAAQFAQLSGTPDVIEWGGEQPYFSTPSAVKEDDTTLVMIDPGHGGIDPGAENGIETEAELMLRFARLLKEVLQRQSGITVALTRNSDAFVSLDRRVAIARRAGADVFLSLHADALAKGQASGATVYSLSQGASDHISAQLVERHERENLMAGVDLRGQDDAIASVLIELAQTETQPRSEQLAEAIIDGLQGEGIDLYKNPHQKAGFSVLKAPDIPSVLIELGFLSSSQDFKNLNSEDWQSRAATAIAAGVQGWIELDAVTRQLIRK